MCLKLLIYASADDHAISSSIFIYGPTSLPFLPYFYFIFVNLACITVFHIHGYYNNFRIKYEKLETLLFLYKPSSISPQVYVLSAEKTVYVSNGQRSP